MAKVSQQSKLITWHECMMAYNKSLEGLDHMMQDLQNNLN